MECQAERSQSRAELGGYEEAGLGSRQFPPHSRSLGYTVVSRNRASSRDGLGSARVKALAAGALLAVAALCLSVLFASNEGVGRAVELIDAASDAAAEEFYNNLVAHVNHTMDGKCLNKLYPHSLGTRPCWALERPYCCEGQS